MIIPLDLSSLSREQIQVWIQTAISEQMSGCNDDFVAASRKAKLLFPGLWDRLNEFSPVRNPSLDLPPISQPVAPARKSSPDLPPVSDPGNPRWSNLTGTHVENPNGIVGPLPSPLRPFRIGFPDAVANDLSTAGVRQTYLDAFSKHMTDHPDCDPIDAHKAVMSAHPALADAMRNQNPSRNLDTAAESPAASPRRAYFDAACKAYVDNPGCDPLDAHAAGVKAMFD
jgi:hypothetical protein